MIKFCSKSFVKKPGSGSASEQSTFSCHLSSVFLFPRANFLQRRSSELMDNDELTVRRITLNSLRLGLFV